MKLLIRFFLLFFIANPILGQEIYVEPPNWWYGMEVDTVQLMLQGADINTLETKLIQDNGASILHTTMSDNPNYLWVTLDLSDVSRDCTLQLRLTDGGITVHQITYDLTQKPSSDVKGFDQSDAIYLITPDRFANADPTNDNISGYTEIADRTDASGRHGGDLQGIHAQIDYIANLGFTTIWLNPIIENNNARYSYHGYGSTDFYQVDRRFGSNEDYRAFVSACHQKGIKVIMDMIHNHCSVEHKWLADLPADNWLNEWESYTETNHQKSTLQDPYASDIDKKKYEDGWFVTTMPDLNQENTELATYLIQNAIWWSIFLDLDGIRMDTWSYSDKDYMSQWIESMNHEVPQVSIVGEEWSVNPAHIAYWQKDKHNVDGFESGLEYLMDFPTNQLLASALVEEESWGQGIVKLYESISNDFQYPSPQDLLIFPDNHDMVRAFTALGEDLDLMKAASIFCLTIRGIPQFYYGTEILMTSPSHRDDGRIRSDYPGGWPDDRINAFTNSGLTESQIVFKEYLSNLLKWRKEELVIHHGKLLHYAPVDGVYVYFRYDENKKVMVILNKNSEDYDLDLSRFEQMLGEASINGTDVISAERVIADNLMNLQSRRSYIIEIE